MGLGSDMKNLTDELLNSFKLRISENEELVNDVQKTLDGFRKDHQEMADVLHANAAALRKGLARGEKERISTFNGLLAGIHGTIASIQKEVVDIQASTLNMINDFTAERGEMAGDLDKFFTQGRNDRMKNEKSRMKEFDALMKSINDDIRVINEEVSAIFRNTNDMLDRFDKEHAGMSDELRAELGKNLSERVEYTRSLLNGFQKKLVQIGKENMKTAQKLRKDLASGETSRLGEYNDLMKEIHLDIKGIRKEVKDIEKSTTVMLDDLLQNRVQASAEWNKMQDAMAQVRKTGVVKAPKEAVKKADKKESKKDVPVEAKKEASVKAAPAPAAVPETPKTLEEKVLDYITRHPKGVKISEMEEPLAETRMKLGFTAKGLLDKGKVLKVDNIYYPKP
jgi:hypothetical protein